MITKNPNAKKNEQLLQEIAKFLFFHGYFHVVKRKKSQPLVGAFIDQLCSELALNSCFIIRDIAPPCISTSFSDNNTAISICWVETFS